MRHRSRWIASVFVALVLALLVNLQEAVELFFETADPSEMARRRHSEVFVTRLEVEIG